MPQEKNLQKRNYQINIDVNCNYLEDESRPTEDQYVFAYTVTVKNEGNIAARLLSRHWIIHHGNGKIEEVRGEGVVGEQPHMNPGEGFKYTSGAVIESDVGTMQGSYRLIADDGQEFDVEIPCFTLSIPRILH